MQNTKPGLVLLLHNTYFKYIYYCNIQLFLDATGNEPSFSWAILLTVLFNRDVKKISHFSKIMNLQEIALSLILLFWFYLSSGFFCARTLNECSPIPVRQLVLLLHTCSIHPKYQLSEPLACLMIVPCWRKRNIRKWGACTWKASVRLSKPLSHHCEGRYLMQHKHWEQNLRSETFLQGRL